MTVAGVVGVQAGFERVDLTGLGNRIAVGAALTGLTVVGPAAVDVGGFVRSETDIVADVVLCEVGHTLFLEVRPDSIVDGGEFDTRFECLHRDGLGLHGEFEVVALLIVGVTDEHRPFELRPVAVDVRARTGDEHITRFEPAVRGVTVGKPGLWARDESGVGRPGAANSRDVPVAQRVEHSTRGLQRCALADCRRVCPLAGLLREIPVCEVRPPGGLPHQGDLGVGFLPAHPVDPGLCLDRYLVGQRRSLVAHHTRRPVCVPTEHLDPQFGEHRRDCSDRVALRVVEVGLYPVDPGVRRDTLALQSRYRHRCPVRRHDEHGRPLGLDVVKAGEIGDTGRAEPPRRVRVGLRQALAHRLETALVLAVGQCRRQPRTGVHTPLFVREPSNRFPAGR